MASVLLRIVLPNRKTYFFDLRLGQLRNVSNPHDFIDLTDDETVLLCKVLLTTEPSQEGIYDLSR